MGYILPPGSERPTELSELGTRENRILLASLGEGPGLTKSDNKRQKHHQRILARQQRGLIRLRDKGKTLKDKVDRRPAIGYPNDNEGPMQESLRHEITPLAVRSKDVGPRGMSDSPSVVNGVGRRLGHLKSKSLQMEDEVAHYSRRMVADDDAISVA